MSAGTAVVVGVGARAGLGASLAERFAREGFRVFVAGRTAANLEGLAKAIEAAGGHAVAKVTDATSEADVGALFEAAAKEGDLELVAYNVGNMLARPFLDLSAADFETIWRLNALGGFLVGQAAVRHLLPRAKGTILFTGATASLRARPPFTAFASAKAALRAVAQGLAREFGPKGIHVAHIIVDGVINGDFARGRFADFVRAKGEDGLIDPQAIAQIFLDLHRQPRTAWTHEIDLRPFKETF